MTRLLSIFLLSFGLVCLYNRNAAKYNYRLSSDQTSSRRTKGGQRAVSLTGALVNRPGSATGGSADIAVEAVIEEGHDLQLFMWEGSW